MNKPTLSEYLAGIKARCEKIEKRKPLDRDAPFEEIEASLKDDIWPFIANARPDLKALVKIVEAFWHEEGYPEDNLPTGVEAAIPEEK